MIFLNILMFLRSTIAISMNALKETGVDEFEFLLYLSEIYSKKDLKRKHIDVKLATNNWIEICENNKCIDKSKVTALKIIANKEVKVSTEKCKISTSRPDGLYNYFSGNLPEFKEFFKQENTNKEELKNVVRSYMIKDKVPDVLKKEIEHVIDNNMNGEEAMEHLVKKNGEFNAFLNFNNVCEAYNQDPENCEIYFFFHGTYLDGKRFFYTDAIHIKRLGEELEFELIPIFDDDQKVDVPEN